MKNHFFLSFLIFMAFIFVFSSTVKGDAKFQEVDALIESGSMINAMDALEILNSDFGEDTLNASFWVRFAQASRILYNYSAALTAVKKAISIDPDNADFFFEKALLYNQSRELTKAISALDKAIELNTAGEYFFWRGVIYQQLNNFKEAESDYMSAIELRFENSDLYNNLAIIQSNSNEFEKALQSINSAIMLDENSGRAYSARASINFFQLNFQECCNDIKTAHKNGFTNTLSVPDSFCKTSLEYQYTYAAEVFFAEEHYERSIKAYTWLIENTNKESNLFLNRGYANFKIKDFDQAEKDYLKALSLENPVRDLLYDNLSLLYYEQDQFEKCIEFSTKRIDLNPENYVPYIDRGLCNRKIKKYDAAQADFNKSLEINPEFFRAYGYRSYLNLELGKFEDAYNDASRSIEINPDYGYGYLVLGQAEKALGMNNFCHTFVKAYEYGWPEVESFILEHCR